MTTQQIPAEKQPKPKYMAKCVSLTQEADDVLLFCGNGNRSRGIRELVRLFLRLAEDSQEEEHEN